MNSSRWLGREGFERAWTLVRIGIGAMMRVGEVIDVGEGVRRSRRISSSEDPDPEPEENVGEGGAGERERARRRGDEWEYGKRGERGEAERSRGEGDLSSSLCSTWYDISSSSSSNREDWEYVSFSSSSKDIVLVLIGG